MKKRNWFILLILIVGSTFLLGGCQKQEVEEPEKVEGEEDMVLEQLQAPKKGEEIAIIKTNHGDIKLRLFPEVAPKAVENFTTHAKDGYYDGVIFHRVIEDFMIQGGDPAGVGTGGESIWGENFEDEFHNDYRNFRGALSMANTGQPVSNGSQFFIVQNGQSASDGEVPTSIEEAYEKLGGTPHLDGRHTVFGQVFEGMDVVDEIAGTDVDGNDKPLEPVIMETIEIVKY